MYLLPVALRALDVLQVWIPVPEAVSFSMVSSLNPVRNDHRKRDDRKNMKRTSRKSRRRYTCKEGIYVRGIYVVQI